jgi:hypothetical protein
MRAGTLVYVTQGLHAFCEATFHALSYEGKSVTRSSRGVGGIP